MLELRQFINVEMGNSIRLCTRIEPTVFCFLSPNHLATLPPQWLPFVRYNEFY